MLLRKTTCLIGLIFAPLCLNCQPAPRESAELVLPATFVEQLKEGTRVKFEEDPARLASMTDAQFEQLLASYRSFAASETGASAAAIETAIDDLRRERQAARAQAARPGGSGG